MATLFRKEVNQKLNARNRMEAARMAEQKGWL